MMVAMQTPERKVSRRGKGILIPRTLRRPAYFHQPASVRNPNIPTTVAIAEIGSSTVPLIGVAVRKPFARDFVRALYGV
jgi:hypothetical protein